jgi:predicted tellurium resistance membrane protein TerC
MDSLFTLAADPEAWIALLTLVVMEVVLGIDNLIFIAVLTNRLAEQQRETARRIGIGLAAVLRLIFLSFIAIIVRLTAPLFVVFGHGFSWRDLILIAGGLFLLWKATGEIHHRVDPQAQAEDSAAGPEMIGLAAAVGQIVVLDCVFSIDSIVTAVGMTEHVPIMIIAMLIAVSAMFFAATPLANLIRANPAVVMLALGFLMMIGMTLIAEGFGVHVPKGYIYAAMAFSAFVESLNLLERKARSRKAKRKRGATETDP